MKLWLKQTVITLAVILLAVSLCRYYFTVKETEGLIRETVRNGERDTQVFCDYLSTLDREIIQAKADSQQDHSKRDHGLLQPQFHGCASSL